MRSDAKQNREQLMDIARNAFVTTGEISMTALAKKAGVGVGTLYRHFPTRESLVVAVYQHEIETLGGLATTLLAEYPPYEALRLWFERLAHYGRMKYGVAAIIHGANNDGAERDAYVLIVGAIGKLLEAGASAGVLKTDLDAEDVLLIVTFLWRLPPSPDVEARATRMLALVLDGLALKPSGDSCA